MTNRFLEDLLREVFAAQGAVDAAGLARRAAKDFDMAERDRQILLALGRGHGAGDQGQDRPQRPEDQADTEGADGPSARGIAGELTRSSAG